MSASTGTWRKVSGSSVNSAAVISGKADLAYTVEIEIVPPITLADFKTITIDRLTAPVDDAEVDQALERIAEQNRPFVAKIRSLSVVSMCCSLAGSFASTT